MMARAFLVLTLLALAGLAVAAPSAAARPPVVGDCAVGDDADACLVSVHWVVCVTEPCDALRVCIAYGFLCV